MKTFQNNYCKEKITVDFDDDWSGHLRDFEAMSQDYELTNEDCAYFLRCNFKGDTGQFYNTICVQR